MSAGSSRTIGAESRYGGRRHRGADWRLGRRHDAEDAEREGAEVWRGGDRVGAGVGVVLTGGVGGSSHFAEVTPPQCSERNQA